MSKEFTKEDVILNKKEAIKTLNKLLEKYINTSNGSQLKKANLISYWIKDYVRMIDFEEKFDPTKNIAYKRGNIVKVDFGFNIGAEYGGLHYGIVLDNNNAHNSPVVTVIPLTSAKNAKKPHPNSVNLGNEIYRSLKIKYDTISKVLREEQEEIESELALFQLLVELARQTIDEMKLYDLTSQEFEQTLAGAQNYLDASLALQDKWKEKEQHNEEQQDYLNKIGNEIAKMKEGSVALVNQITTISKMRIFDPRNLKGVLSGISLSEENMKKINTKMRDLYIFEK